MEIVVKPAKPEDLDALVDLEGVCFPAAEAAGRDALKARLAVFPQSFFVAWEAETVVGMINGCVTDNPVITDDLYEDASLHDPHGAYQTVFGLDVLPEYRRRGIAALLMERLMQAAKAAGRQGMVLTCKEALIPYYERFGYQNCGVSESTHGNALWYDMKRPL